MQKNSIILNFKVYFILHSGFNHHILQKKLSEYIQKTGVLIVKKNIHHLKERHKRENGKHRHHSLKLMEKKQTRLLIF